MMSAKKLSPYLFALIFPLIVFVLYKTTLSYLGDTDRYYHFAVSRMLSERGAFSLPALPQAEDLGWATYFPDKEFLFHAFTRLGYSLGGEGGVAGVSLAFAAGLGALLYIFALGYLPPALALFCAVSAFVTQSVIFRLLLVRPHVLALFIFILLNIALIRRRPVLSGLTAAAFMLAYHAFYLPLLCFGLAFVLSFRDGEEEKRQLRKALGFGLIGLVLGCVINPYFPSQLAMGLHHAKIPFLLAGDLKGANFGTELYPLSAPLMLKFYYLPFLVLLAAIFTFRRSFAQSYLLCLTLFFSVLAFQTFRGGEYLVPVSGLLLAVVAGQLFEKNQRRLFPALLGLTLVQLALLIHVARTEASFIPDGLLYSRLNEAVAAIPPGPAKVLNCEWDTAPFLLNARPDLRFVDLLDPSFLYVSNPALFRERKGLSAGTRSDPFRVVAAQFRADYVLCRDLGLAAQLAADPAFQQVYPRTGPSPVYLFRRSTEVPAAFVRAFELSAFAPESVAAAREYMPGTDQKLQPVSLPEGTIALEQYDLPSMSFVCKTAKVSAAEIRRLAGARYLGLGGGQAIRAFRNGKLLYASGPGFTRARSLQAVVPLSPALAVGDRLDILVCSGGQSPYVALAVSLWSEAEAKMRCAWKRELLDGDDQAFSESQFTSDTETCLGPMAAPALPAALKLR